MSKKYIKPNFYELSIETNMCVGSYDNNCTHIDLNVPSLNKKKRKTFIIDDDYEEYWNHNF